MSIAAAFPYILSLFPHPTGPLSPTNPAYIYIAVILESLGREPLVGDLWRHIAEHFPSQDDQIIFARRLREGLLKASVLVGFPRGINGLAALKNAVQSTSPLVAERLSKDRSLRQSVSKADREARGKAFFAKVYAQHADKVLNSMAATSGGDLSEFAVTCVYGDLMAETSILSEKETGLLEFASCYTAGAWPQAKGHMYGSRNLGNGKLEVEGVVAMCHAVAQAVGVDLEREGKAEWAFLEKLKSWSA